MRRKAYYFFISKESLKMYFLGTKEVYVKYIFIHGGPGLNSNPERHLLKLAPGHEIVFWDEPSSLRDRNYTVDSAYKNWLDSLSKFIRRHSEKSQVTLIAHSFGAYALNEVLPSIEKHISGVILLAPIFDLLNLDRNILDLAIRLKAHKADLKAMAELNESKQKIGTAFNDMRFTALLKALGDEEVLPNYWHNHSASGNYNQYFATDEAFQIDFGSFKAVRESISHNTISNKYDGKVILYYGAFDPVAKLEQDYKLVKELYPNSVIKIAQDSGHYPHIEEMASFLKWLQIDFQEATDRV